MPRQSYIRNATWNYLGPLSSGFVGLLVVAVIARRVNPAEYGAFLLALAVAEAAMLLDLGLLGILPRAFIAERQSGGVAAETRLLSAAVAALAKLAGIAMVASLVVAWLIRIGRFSSLAADIAPRVAVVVVLIGAMVQIALPSQAITKVYEAAQQFVFLGRLEAMLAIGRATGSLLLLRQGYGTPALGVMLVAEALTRIVVLICFLPRQTGGVELRGDSRDRSALARTWAPGGWVLLENVANQAIYGIDSFVLSIFSSLRSVAVLGIGRRIPNQLWLAVMRSLGVTLPTMAELHATGNDIELRRFFMSVCTLLSVPVIGIAAAIAALSTPLIAWLAGGRYMEAVPVMQWLLLTVALHTLAIPSMLLLYARGQMAKSARVTTLEAIGNVALSLALARPYGAAGVAAATALTHLAATLFGFVPAAGRVAQLRGREVLVSVARDLLVPALFGGAVFVLLQAVAPGYSPLVSVVRVGSALAIYLAVWGWRAARPAWRLSNARRAQDSFFGSR